MQSLYSILTTYMSSPEVASTPQLSLSDKLRAFATGETERYSDILTRLSAVAFGHNRDRLELEDIINLQAHLPYWRLAQEPRIIDGLPYWISNRRLAAEPGFNPDRLDLKSSRRTVGADGKNIVVMTRSIMTGEDMTVILRIEKKLLSIKEKKRQDETEFWITPREKQALWLYAQPGKVVASTLGVRASTVRTWMKDIRTRNNMNQEQLIRTAFMHNLIDLEPLPPIKKHDLSARQSDLLRNYAFRTHEATALELNISPKTVGAHWTNIHKELGVFNRRHAYLVALRDGIV